MPSLTWSGKTLSHPEPVPLTLDSVIYPGGASYPNIPDDSRDNQLILGDNLSVMATLLPDYEGRIHLIYADPPFFTNRAYPARIGRGEDSRKPAEWQLAEGYGDHWDNLDAYIDFLYQRLALMARLLAPGGTLYLHLDWHADAYARLLLDEIFGAENFLNEIIWTYHGPSPIRSAFNRKHDTILSFTKGQGYTFNADAVRVPYDSSTVKTFAASTKAGFGKVPDLERGKVPEDWWYFPVVARLHNERTGYPTQKPEALLERIILASSNPGDLVADFFCGSGTTPLVAARHGRRFLSVDATSRAIYTARKRLVSLPATPFSIRRQAAGIQVKDPKSAAVRIQRSKQEITISPADDLIYWEIDPDWDGQVFNSAAQSVRPLRHGTIAASLPVAESKTGRSICVRAVTSDGEQHQIVL
jgi:site-specific DNA-methyltransferase (adenine-specific)